MHSLAWCLACAVAAESWCPQCSEVHALVLACARGKTLRYGETGWPDLRLDCVLQVKFFLNTDPSSEAAEPVYVATAAPFVMGTTDDGQPKTWAFEAGEVSICAQVVPSTEDGEMVSVTETGTALDAGSAEVLLRLSRLLMPCARHTGPHLHTHITATTRRSCFL